MTKNKPIISIALITSFLYLSVTTTAAQIAERRESDLIKYEQSHPNGTISARYYFDKDHKRAGVWQTYDSDGTLQREFSYHRDLLDGDYKMYYGTSLVGVMQFSDDKLHGDFISFNYNGLKERLVQGQYAKGKKTGKWIYVISNTKIKLEAEYNADSGTSVWTRYDAEGNKQYEISLKNNLAEGALVSYHSNGNINKKGTCKDGYLTGIYSQYDNGEPYIEEDCTGKNRQPDEFEDLVSALKSISNKIIPYEQSRLVR